MIETEPMGEGSLIYTDSDSSFSLHVHKNGKMVSYHKCLADTPVSCNLLIMSEVMERKCMDCGALDIPDTLMSVYILYKFDKVQSRDFVQL